MPPGLAFEDLPPIHVVLISHDHYDHLDVGTVRRLAAAHRPRFLVPLGLRAWFAELGITEVEELDWWQHREVRGLRVTAVPAQHFSGRTPWDRNRRLWAGWTVAGRAKRLYFAGDTAYWDGLREIGERLGPFDLAAIPIGGNVRLHAGTWMMKITSDPKVYAVETDGTLRWIQSEDQAGSLYGADWNKRVRDIDVSLFGEYRIGDPLAPENFHEGYVAAAADGKAWYVAGNAIRHELTKNGREANHYAAAAFDPAALFGRADEARPGWSRLTAGATIDGYDSRLNRVGSVGGTAVIAP